MRNFSYYLSKRQSGEAVARKKENGDYDVFGMLMPGRNYNAPNYRFGYNGKVALWRQRIILIFQPQSSQDRI